MNITYPNKLIERLTHGKSTSHLIKTMSKEAPALPKCIPVGIGTIPLDIIMMDNPDIYSFRINDGDIITVRTDTEDGFDIDALAKMDDFILGKTDQRLVQYSILEYAVLR